MMRHLHRQDGTHLDVEIITHPDVQHFIDVHTDILDSSFREVTMSETMRQSLHNADYIFSGLKTFHELNEAFPKLIDENGNRKSFEQFYNDVQTIDETYNRNYLRAEYDFAHAAAQMAARWEQIEQDGDEYHLQYRTALDPNVRPEHAALHGVTLPPSDPFWKLYYPPNGWGCRCTAVQVSPDKYPDTPREEAMQRGQQATQRDKRGIFRFNAGLQRKTFPDYNPYTIQRCNTCDIAQGKTTLAFIRDNELCQACRIIRQMKQEEQDRPLTTQERGEIRRAADEWAQRHLDASTNANGQPIKRIVINHDRVQNGIIVNRKFFGETFTKGNRRDNRRLAEQMELATRINDWLPQATYIRTEAGLHHPYPFDVFEATIAGVTIECKVAMKHTGAYAYTMRIKN